MINEWREKNAKKFQIKSVKNTIEDLFLIWQ